MPFKYSAAAYCISMPLYYILHVFVYDRSDPYWLEEIYWIVSLLPGIVGLRFQPKGNTEETYRHFIRTAFYIMIAFNLFCMITGTNLVTLKRWISAGIMISLPVAFFALFLRLNNKSEQL
jgi:hypothetical protein